MIFFEALYRIHISFVDDLKAASDLKATLKTCY